MYIETICSKCQKNFQRNTEVGGTMALAVGRKSSPECYACALTSLTGGRAPEEGDLNSARLISGEISDKELGWLMEDLRAVESGSSVLEPYSGGAAYNDYVVDRFPYCGSAGHDDCRDDEDLA